VVRVKKILVFSWESSETSTLMPNGPMLAGPERRMSSWEKLNVHVDVRLQCTPPMYASESSPQSAGEAQAGFVCTNQLEMSWDSSPGCQGGRGLSKLSAGPRRD